MSEKKPEIYLPRPLKYCPVCGKVSYSLSGEHPQCSQARADAIVRAKLKKSNERRPGQTASK